MELNLYVGRYRRVRQNFYDWRDSAETVQMLMLAFIFACLTGLGAFMRVYTPFTPVPFTAQVFFVLLSGTVLGSRYGGLSQVIYVLLGVIGVPWFAGGAAGVEYMMGATGGYLVGFILAAALVGHLVNGSSEARTLPALLPIMLLGVLVIYAIGATWLAIVLDLSAWQAITLGVAAFIALGMVKALLAAGVGRMVTTRGHVTLS
jgi:biotin transport system substrate-specific component